MKFRLLAVLEKLKKHYLSPFSNTIWCIKVPVNSHQYLISLGYVHRPAKKNKKNRHAFLRNFFLHVKE